MIDAHQPGPEDRAAAEATDAAEEAPPDPDELAPDDERLERLREERPSSRNDPNAPDRPRT